jgi:hypothetical protein
MHGRIFTDFSPPVVSSFLSGTVPRRSIGSGRVIARPIAGVMIAQWHARLATRVVRVVRPRIVCAREQKGRCGSSPKNRDRCFDPIPARQMLPQGGLPRPAPAEPASLGIARSPKRAAGSSTSGYQPNGQEHQFCRSTKRHTSAVVGRPVGLRLACAASASEACPVGVLKKPASHGPVIATVPFPGPSAAPTLGPQPPNG